MALALLATCVCAPLAAQDFDPSHPDLPAMIECRIGPRDYNGFGFFLMGEPEALAKLGWTELDSGNPMVRQFRLPQPVTAFGRETSELIFASAGPLAVFENVTPQAIAGELGITAAIDTPGKYLGEKIVLESVEEVDGYKFDIRVALNVSTIDTHPGKVLAGCTYRIEPKT